MLGRLLAGVSLASLLGGAAMAQEALTLSVLGTYKTGVFDEGAAEIVAHAPGAQRLYVVNGHAKEIDILDIKTPAAPQKTGAISLAGIGKAATSVAVVKDRVVAAVEGASKQDKGVLAVFDLDGKLIGKAEVGALPDMVAVTPDGKHALTANEGEPSKDYKTDPEGSVSIIDLASLSVRTVSFAGLDKAAFGDSAHFPSPAGTSVAQDLEPEYIAIAPDGKRAFVTLQENNAIAVIDIAGARVEKVFGLGVKDWSKSPFDASDRNNISMRAYPVKGLYQPDAIAAFAHQGATYVVTANEGDARDYEGYSEEARVKDARLDGTIPDTLKDDKALGRLKVTTAKGDTDGDGDLDQLFAFGGRSFSIYTADGTQVYDSGGDFERILSSLYGPWFNSEGQVAEFDKRSDDKGPEPEGVALGEIGGTLYAFIGLERMGGVMVYDLSDPQRPAFVTHAHNGLPNGDPKAGTAGDVAPEGVTFIPASQSPTNAPLLVLANEVSGTTTIYEVRAAR